MPSLPVGGPSPSPMFAPDDMSVQKPVEFSQNPSEIGHVLPVVS